MADRVLCLPEADRLAVLSVHVREQLKWNTAFVLYRLFLYQCFEGVEDEC